MKTLTCDLCEVTVQGETFEEWMNNLKPHYATAHPEVMGDSSKTNEDMEKWMVENKARFDAAPND
jgi:predicted RNase H-like HicB family nuclease